MRRKGWLGIVVLAAAAGGAAWWLRAPEPEAKPVYRAIAVERGTVEVTTLATGVVQPQNRLEIKPPIAGRMEQILVREGDRVRQGQTLGWMSSLERAALLDVARSKGAEELAHWEELYKPAPLLAPLGGTIIARAVEPGQTVTIDLAVFVLSDRLLVKAQVDETDIGRIALGQEATVTLDAFSQSPLPARVSHIAYEAVTVNNVTVYEVDVLTDATPPFMRSGMTANVTFRIARRENVLVLPAEAVEEREGETVTRVPGGEAGPKERVIETGLSDRDRIEIVAGLAEGERVMIPVLRLPESASQGSSPLFSFGRPRGGGSGGTRQGGARQGGAR